MKKLLVLLACLAAIHGFGQAKKGSHDGFFEHYEGTKTCLKCHTKEAKTFFNSQHYQWQGEAPQIVNAKGKKLGKINTVNDFCTNPLANWIGDEKNSQGDSISQGCSKCHAGLGLVPSGVESQEQLENIDCLICHAKGYQRNLFPKDGGGWEWKPILWNNREGLDSVSKRIILPSKTNCLRCHAGSGGGQNYKRGDLEYDLADCDRNFDVHSGKDGVNFECIDCHKGDDHRVRGRGTDLSGTDSPLKPLSCDGTECHGPTPHKSVVINTHTQKVYCTVCHIPSFAKTDATDMARDWSKPSYNKDKEKYSATIELQKNVIPVYAWYNGTTYEQLLGEPVKKLADGTVGMMVPQGNRSDARAKIFAFKLHKGKMPVLKGKEFILPIEVEEFFKSGEMDKAIKGAAEKTYGVKDASYYWVDTTRYMGIFHEAVPKEKALSCLDCHDTGKRLDWKALGYESDPLLSKFSADIRKKAK
jgi:hypothetical protein